MNKIALKYYFHSYLVVTRTSFGLANATVEDRLKYSLVMKSPGSSIIEQILLPERGIMFRKFIEYQSRFLMLTAERSIDFPATGAD